ncbi:DDB1- and CUL4-associated factor 4-like [Triticum dicoccoides]|uniref:Transducin/WD40 repeat-like superfamily protein n=1 Tax=Triticum turgidum subsp. durum TaxID=4567 RepID=A0A9R1PP32_TRITD|nr:DDB1- and CUL4-associated factor 4-like [Triticum dicoccoides]VAH46564.1 unnamed protein product [Triticum turgidum subsp. durum]
MPPKELPGLYYDPEKNRYFPTKGRIPGAATRPPRPPPPPAEPSPPPTARRKRARQSELLHAREMYGGGVIFSKNNKSTFKQQCQYTQASQPMVWKYQGTTLVADKALEELHAMVQTPSGLRESKLLATGSTNGSIRLFGLGTALENFEDEMEFLPQPVWTPLGKQKAAVNSPLANIWSSETAFSNFSSSISCIKKFGHNFHDAASTNSSVQRALVATLGSGGSGGSVYIMDMSTIDSATVSRNAHGRIERVASFDRTVWTADCNSDGTQVVLGTNTGAGLLNLETGTLSWLYRCKSDILSQQFVHSGNVVLCGLRNGSIVPVDVRERHSSRPTGRSSPSTARGTVPMLSARHNARGRNQADKAKSSRVISMPSAVCSLVSLSSDEHYFLGSSMDGSIKLFDLRLIQKGAIQSYAGHVNSHNNLPLVIDPAETLLMSGGEDCTVRIWSIKTGEQIFAKSVADTLFTALCWPESNLDLDGSSSLFDLNHSWGAWMGSRDGLFYMHGT